MPIDHNTTGDSEIEAEPIRLHEQGHGVKGLIFSAHKRQATDWQSRKPLFWEKGDPVFEFVLSLKAEAGKANFAVRDEDGKPKKGPDGRTILEERAFTEQDVCVIASGKGSYELYKQCEKEKVNEGMVVTIRRGAKSGTKVEYEVEVLSKDNPLSRYDTDRAAPSGIDHGAETELVESAF